jgi:hypothetical protein
MTARTTRQGLGDLYHHQIRPRLSPDEVYSAVAFTSRAGSRWRGPCPLHGGAGPNFSVDPVTLVWTCHSACQASGGPLEYLHRLEGGDGRPRGADFVRLVRDLARRAGVEVHARGAAARVATAVITAAVVATSRTSQKAPSSGTGSGEAAVMHPGPAVSAATAADPYPPSSKALALWGVCVPVTADTATAKMLQDRGLEPEALADLDMVRVIPKSVARTDLPTWAGYTTKTGRWVSWAQRGNRLVTPLYDATGEMRAMRFRLDHAPSQAEIAAQFPPKSAGPCGVRSRGLVMADPAAVEMLRTGAVPFWWDTSVPFSVVVVEGEPDFWSWSTESLRRNELSEAALRFPAVLGITSGSFTAEIAARIPDGARVISAVDADAAGEKYHARICRLLEARWAAGKLTVARWKGRRP